MRTLYRILAYLVPSWVFVDLLTRAVLGFKVTGLDVGLGVLASCAFILLNLHRQGRI
jgi:hypothetical protein